MRRLVTVATFLLLCTPVLLAQARFHGIPASVTSITPARFGHGGHFGGRTFVGGGFRHGGFHNGGSVRFGHGFNRHNSFGVFVGFNRFPRYGYYGYRGYYPGYAPYPIYAAAPAYAYPPAYSVTDDARYYERSSYIELTREVDRLRLEVDRMREEREQRSQAAPQPPRSAYKPPADHPATMLVFRNGQRQEVKNSAVAGQTLWIFTEQRARKLPLSDLDLEATRAVNEERGSDFHTGNNH